MNDHEQLRYDPAKAIALEKLNFIESTEAILAGKYLGETGARIVSHTPSQERRI